MNRFCKSKVVLAIFVGLANGVAIAEKGGVYDADGSVWRTSDGECWTTDYRDQDMAAGCMEASEHPITEESEQVAQEQEQGQQQELDGDGDGIVDAQDQCPKTPHGAEVDELGCALDSDSDGIADYDDQCPHTPEGSEVDNVGCSAKIALDDVYFEIDSGRLDQESITSLKEIAVALKEQKGAQSLQVVGHTDSSGEEDYNQSLSEQRAKVVAEFLVSEGIEASNIETKGMGESLPIADNNTPEGREKNRRVELKMN
jgi:OOP family OmpA-OmpF porin